MKAEYDFSKAKRATEVPHLNQLREDASKTRITMYVDSDILSEFKAKASSDGIGYQTEINRVLRQYIKDIKAGGLTLEEMIRKAVREEVTQLKAG
jgi:uncharacterized protein (DUF4415 family)